MQTSLDFRPRWTRRIVRCDRGAVVRFEARSVRSDRPDEYDVTRAVEFRPVTVGSKEERWEGLKPVDPDRTLTVKGKTVPWELSPFDLSDFFRVPCSLPSPCTRKRLDEWLDGGADALFGRRRAPCVAA